jgi:DNA-binding NtrC family response regulator
MRNHASKIVYLDHIELHSKADQAYWSERIIESEMSRPGAPRRVLVSTNCDLERLSRQNDFDAKLASILNRFVVSIPPLRDRPEDVIPLADSLSRQLSCRIGRARIAFTAPALRLLQRQPWPGNVSQLAAMLEQLVAFSPDGLITKRLAISILAGSPASVASLRRDAVRRQRDDLVATLDSTGGNLAEAARRMGMSRGAVIYRAQKFGLLAKRVRGR